jgi:DNA-binding PadR family transcriptional regulator
LKNNWIDLDLRAMAQSLRESVMNFGGFSPEEVRKSGRMSEDDLKIEILRTLENAAKTGFEILSSLETANVTAAKPTAAQTYPLLENMVDTKLISAEIKKDRKVFSLAKAGRALLAEQPARDANQTPEEKVHSTPNWIDLRGDVAKASARLGNVVLDISKNGSKDQQQKAAAALDEARRRLHEILASD